MAGLSATEMNMSGQGFTQVNDIAAFMVQQGMATAEQRDRMTGAGAVSHSITGNERVTSGKEMQNDLVSMGIATQQQVDRHLQKSGAARDAVRTDLHEESLAAKSGVNKGGVQNMAEVNDAIKGLRAGLTNGTSTRINRGSDTPGRGM